MTRGPRPSAPALVSVPARWGVRANIICIGKGDRVKRILAATAAAALTVGIAGCGSPITASHDWQAQTVTSALLISNPAVYGEFDPVLQTGLHGGLLTTNGGTAAGTEFVEECISPVPDGVTYGQIKQGPVPCTVIVNTGHNVYVARGVSTVGYAGSFASLDQTGRGTLTVTVLRAAKTGGALVADSYLVRISAR
jgi:hypothetical protein